MKTLTTKNFKTIKGLIKEAAQNQKDFNLYFQGRFYWSIDGWAYRLREGELIPEQWNPQLKKWIKC